MVWFKINIFLTVLEARSWSGYDVKDTGCPFSCNQITFEFQSVPLFILST